MSKKSKHTTQATREVTRSGFARRPDPDTIFTRQLSAKKGKKNWLLIMMGTLLGIAIPLTVRHILVSGDDSIEVDSVLHQQMESGQLSRSRSEPALRQRTERVVQNQPSPRPVTRSEPPARRVAESAPASTRSRPAAPANNNTTWKAPGSQPQARVARAPVARQPVNPPVATPARPPSQPAPAEPVQAAVAAPAGRQVNDLLLNYNTSSLERCGPDCIVMFRDARGTVVRGSVPLSRYQAQLMQAGGQALVSGILSVRQSEAWLEINGVSPIPMPSPPPVVQAEPQFTPTQPVFTPPPPSPVEIPSEPAPMPVAQPSNIPSPEPAARVNTQNNRRSGDNFQNRLRNVRQAPKAEEAPEDRVDEGDQEESSPFGNFHQRLRRSVGN